jgi:hypothetical protein
MLMKPLRILLLAALVAVTARAGADDCIAMIGTGSVGSTLGPRFAALGKRIVYGSRTPDDERVQALVRRTAAGATAAAPAVAADSCATLVLAVPWEAVEPTIRSLGDLGGKIIIDVTNPLDVREGRVIAVETPGSGGEYLQSLAPGARVVKALNTVNYRIMADPAVAGGTVSVPIAGDDTAAKSAVTALVSGIGLEPVDVGSLSMARFTEAMALLYVNRLVSGKPPFEFYLRPWPTP